MADLVSRKQKADLSQKPASVPDETKALEYHPATEAPVQEIEATPGEQEGQTAPESKPDTAVTKPAETPEPPTDATAASLAEIDADRAAEEGVPHSSADEPGDKTPVVVADDSIEVVTKNPARARKKTFLSAPEVAADQPEATETPAALKRPKTIVEEMAALDVEVATLRRELAKKLSEQNAQLRRMLARFDRR